MRPLSLTSVLGLLGLYLIGVLTPAEAAESTRQIAPVSKTKMIRSTATRTQAKRIRPRYVALEVGKTQTVLVPGLFAKQALRATTIPSRKQPKIIIIKGLTIQATSKVKDKVGRYYKINIPSYDRLRNYQVQYRDKKGNWATVPPSRLQLRMIRVHDITKGQSKAIWIPGKTKIQVRLASRNKAVQGTKATYKGLNTNKTQRKYYITTSTLTPTGTYPLQYFNATKKRWYSLARGREKVRVKGMAMQVKSASGQQAYTKTTVQNARIAPGAKGIMVPKTRTQILSRNRRAIPSEGRVIPDIDTISCGGNPAPGTTENEAGPDLALVNCRLVCVSGDWLNPPDCPTPYEFDPANQPRVEFRCEVNNNSNNAGAWPGGVFTDSWFDKDPATTESWLSNRSMPEMWITADYENNVLYDLNLRESMTLGRHTTYLRVDPQNKLQESNEKNNYCAVTWKRTGQYTEPNDLIITSLSVSPPSGPPETSFSFNVGVQNASGPTAPDFQVGCDKSNVNTVVSGLGPGVSRQVSLTIGNPPIPGNKTVTCTVNALYPNPDKPGWNIRIRETDYDNNTQSIAFEVTQP